MNVRKILSLSAAILVTVASLCACAGHGNSGTVGVATTEITYEQESFILTGKWFCADRLLRLELKEDGSFILDRLSSPVSVVSTESGSYTFSGRTLTLKYSDRTESYEYAVDNGQFLLLNNGEEEWAFTPSAE